MKIEIRNTKYETRTTPAYDMQGQASHERRATRHGFSLMEVLLAVGILAVGMLFIAGVFPVGIHFTTVASERTIAATAADEAFAKIKLYGVNISGLSYVNQTTYDLPPALVGEYAYPSTPTADPNSKRYWWSAVCRRVDVNDVQVTVFISRKVGTTQQYYGGDGTRPVAFRVSVGGGGFELTIASGSEHLINDGYTIVDDATGQIYRVLERYQANPGVIRLDKDWQGGALPGWVWVVPPPAGGGRYPCIAVYQKVMRF